MANLNFKHILKLLELLDKDIKNDINASYHKESLKDTDTPAFTKVKMNEGKTISEEIRDMFTTELDKLHFDISLGGLGKNIYPENNYDTSLVNLSKIEDYKKSNVTSISSEQRKPL